MTTLSQTGERMPTSTASQWISLGALALTLVGWAFSGLAVHDTDAASIKERVTKVETKIESSDARLQRIEAKIDHLLEQR